jgi:hypothetical protein
MLVTQAVWAQGEAKLSTFSNRQIYEEITRREAVALSAPSEVLRTKNLFISKSLIEGVAAQSLVRTVEMRTVSDDALSKPQPSPAKDLIQVSDGSLRQELLDRTDKYKLQMKSLYGELEDPRLDILEVSEEVQKRKQIGMSLEPWSGYMASAEAVGFIVPVSLLQQLPSGDYYVLSAKYGERYDLCSTGERFVDQQCVKGIGTTFLISSQTTCTAAHCVPSQIKASDLRILFGYVLDQPGPVQSVIIKKDDVYSVKQVVVRHPADDGPDWAILQLDRPCNRKPLKFGAGHPDKNTKVYAIGYPYGLALKVAPAAPIVSEVGPNNCFTAAVDTYAGNSGCPIINEATNEVEGLLVKGWTDFKWIDINNTCKRSVVITDQTQGELICSASAVKVP